MIKKDALFKWSNIQNDAFNKIKKSIMDAPTLMPHEFSKDFLLYNFATNFSYAAMLTQKNAEDTEIPMSFMSSTFKGAKLNYT